eukprot:6204034-Pleurochrysis_carterae.AAC.1
MLPGMMMVTELAFVTMIWLMILLVVEGILGPSLRQWAGQREVPVRAPTRHATLFGHAHMCAGCVTRGWLATSPMLWCACRPHRAAVGWLPLYPSRGGARTLPTAST